MQPLTQWFIYSRQYQGYQQATKIKYRDIFLTSQAGFWKCESEQAAFITGGQLHFHYIYPLSSPFNVSISSFGHIRYLQLPYLKKWQFFHWVIAFSVSYKCKSLTFSLASAYEIVIPRQTAIFPDNSPTFQSKQNSLIFQKVEPWLCS